MVRKNQAGGPPALPLNAQAETWQKETRVFFLSKQDFCRPRCAVEVNLEPKGVFDAYGGGGEHKSAESVGMGHNQGPAVGQQVREHTVCESAEHACSGN